MTHRVVITGMGAVTPLGLCVEETWDAMKAGKVGVGPVTRLDTGDSKISVAAEVKGFDPAAFMDKKLARRLDRFCQYAMAAGKMAMEDAALQPGSYDGDRFGVVVGSGIGGMETMEREISKLATTGLTRKTAPLTVPMMIGNMASGILSLEMGLHGPCLDVVTACATGTDAVGTAFRMVKYGQADKMLCGGTEAPLTLFAMGAFANLDALTRSEDPMAASVPFDARRSGFVMGEGAAVLVLESLESAKARGAKIYAEILGCGETADGYHMTAPDPEGRAAARAMTLAMEEGGIFPEQVDYINAHGTSTPLNDKTETRVIRLAMGEAAEHVAVSSTKSMTGHMLGAAGAIETIVCALAIRDGYIPATVGYQEPDPDCDLDVVPNVGRNQPVRYALTNSLGFGGHNATLLLGKYEEA